MAIMSLIGPYFVCYLLLIFHDFKMRNIGRYISFIWLSSVYLIFPVSDAMNRRLANSHRVTIKN